MLKMKQLFIQIFQKLFVGLPVAQKLKEPDFQ
jgi:hypothetical protein